jgi:hypothetical protein
MEGKFSFSNIQMDFSPQDCGEMIRMIREGHGQSTGRAAAIIGVEKADYENAEAGGENAMIVLHMIEQTYTNLQITVNVKPIKS